MDKYMLKLHEYYTPQAIRVYCANANCAAYQHPRHFNNSNHRYTTAVCGCSTKTCVGCKSTWTADHACVATGSISKPHWLPEYSATCRVKQCPKCKEWIQLSEACNHMSCVSCHHEFCFVCMLPFKSFHGSAGCPMYGDPKAGYDEDGVEKTKRGLHLYPGRDRDGHDRKGVNAQGEQRPETTEHALVSPQGPFATLLKRLDEARNRAYEEHAPRWAELRWGAQQAEDEMTMVMPHLGHVWRNRQVLTDENNSMPALVTEIQDDDVVAALRNAKFNDFRNRMNPSKQPSVHAIQ